MREIKFRGKRIDNGEWVYGYYAFACRYDDSFRRHWIYPKSGNVEEVDPETVGQFIVNEDGNDIFEGDKIQETKHERVINEFIARDIRTIIRRYDDSEHDSIWKVIGTIHDSPTPPSTNNEGEE